MDEKKQNKNTRAQGYIKDEIVFTSKPKPVASCNYFEFNDMKKGQVRKAHFTLRNIGGPFKNFDIKTAGPEKTDKKSSFLKILELKPVDKTQDGKLPVKVFFEAAAPDWSKRYSANILITLDDAIEEVTVNLDTQTKPVNDFARILSLKDIKKITALINKTEKLTGTEIAVVTTDSLEGKTIENFATGLFNEWGIGKEDKNNGLLFLIDVSTSSFRIEVGLGIEEIITAEFINNTSAKYVVPNFRNNKFGNGVYLALTDIFAEIYRDTKKIKNVK
jgi:hypothetical protein